MTSIKIFTFNPFQENTYLLFDETKECVIIDPGNSDKAETKQLVDFVERNELKVVAIWNTHCHIDHVLGNYNLSDLYKVDVVIPKGEQEVLHSVKLYAHMYGFPDYKEAENITFFETDTAKFGNSELNILSVPGHTPGHIAFHHVTQNFCIAGDVLFDGSIGRTDLPGGDHPALISSIRNILFKLHDDTVVYCGHGLSTTIGKEKQTNPFVGIHLN